MTSVVAFVIVSTNTAGILYVRKDITFSYEYSCEIISKSYKLGTLLKIELTPGNTCKFIPITLDTAKELQLNAINSKGFKSNTVVFEKPIIKVKFPSAK